MENIIYTLRDMAFPRDEMWHFHETSRIIYMRHGQPNGVREKNHNNYYYGVPRECSYLQLKPVSEYPVYIPFQNGMIDCLQCGCVHIEIVHS